MDTFNFFNSIIIFLILSIWIEFEIITILLIFSFFTVSKISFISLIVVEDIFLFIRCLLLVKKNFTSKVDVIFGEFKKFITDSSDPIIDIFFFLNYYN